MADPIQFNCLHVQEDGSMCNAHPGDDCRFLHAGGIYVGVPGMWHDERREAAENMPDPEGYTPTKDEFMAAIESDPNIPA